MSRNLAILGVGVVVVLGAHASNGEDFKVASAGGAGCAANSWSPEVYTLYGDSATVTEKVSKIDAQLPKRRVYVFLKESSSGAELTLFERADENNVKVSKWTPKSAGDLSAEIHKAILANKGVNCIGEQAKAIIAKAATTDLKDLGTVPAPETGKAAVGHALKGLDKDDFVRLTLFLLC